MSMRGEGKPVEVVLFLGGEEEEEKLLEPFLGLALVGLLFVGLPCLRGVLGLPLGGAVFPGLGFLLKNLGLGNLLFFPFTSGGGTPFLGLVFAISGGRLLGFFPGLVLAPGRVGGEVEEEG